MIQPAASVLLTRHPGSREVYLIRRGDQLRFFGGFWAFPGGKVAASDGGLCGPAGAKLEAAAREMFEETGVLIARLTDGSFPGANPDFARFRRQLLDEEKSFPQILTEFGLHLEEGDFRLIGTITTPPFAVQRYETAFFVAHLPVGQEPEIWPGELAQGRWASPRDMLACWTRGECFLSPPTLTILEGIGDRPIDDAPQCLAATLATLGQGSIHPIFFAPDVRLIPLETPVLPPASHTNAYLVGSGPVYLIDPGAPDPVEQKRLFKVLDEHAARGRRVTAVVLTHHHPDHVGAAAACAHRYRVPIWAHPWTATALSQSVEVSRPILDGDHLDLGPCRAGGRWSLQAMHTPGHAPGHLAFFEPRYGLLFAGDMVSTVSSVVIAPPEGDLIQYLQSLERLRSLPCRLLLPGHGNASARPRRTIENCLDNRRQREEMLLAALAQGPRGIDELAPELYKGLPANLMPYALLQIRAGLLKLEAEGRAEQLADQTWQLLHRATK